jgi:hypothetical protein
LGVKDAKWVLQLVPNHLTFISASTMMRTLLFHLRTALSKPSVEPSLYITVQTPQPWGCSCPKLPMTSPPIKVDSPLTKQENSWLPEDLLGRCEAARSASHLAETFASFGNQASDRSGLCSPTPHHNANGLRRSMEWHAECCLQFVSKNDNR